MHPDAKFAIDMGLKELMDINDKFKEFAESVKGLAIYPYISEEIDNFKKYYQGLAELIAADLDRRKMSQSGFKQWSKLQMRRAEILSDIYNHYHEEL